MIYLSAQPDETYFIWQLRVQLLNFKDHSIPAEDIHVLIGYKEDIGLNPLFEDFIRENKDSALFFTYPDTRTIKVYSPSIRPHIIHKHFSDNLYLEKEVIFYHDADILFTNGLPNFSKLSQNNIIYLSDTRNYLDSKYIIKRGGISTLKDMAAIVGINVERVIANDQNAGGAQYLLKNIPVSFWKKIEHDCANIFLRVKNKEKDNKQAWVNSTGIYIGEPFPVWCSDMWALLWNLVLLNFEIQISPELDFCWPTNPRDAWERCNIFHNAGTYESTSKKYLHKSLFYDLSPDETDLNFIESNSCSHLYASYLERSFKIKFDLYNATFLIHCNGDSSEDNMEMTERNLTFLERNYTDFNVLVLSFNNPKVSAKLNEIRKRTKISFVIVNSLEEMKSIIDQGNWKSSSLFISYVSNIVVHPSEIFKGIIYVNSKKVDIALCHSNKFVYTVKNSLKRFFLQTLDVRLLSKHLFTEGNPNSVRDHVYAWVGSKEIFKMMNWCANEERISNFMNFPVLSALEMNLKVKTFTGPAYLLV